MVPAIVPLYIWWIYLCIYVSIYLSMYLCISTVSGAVPAVELVDRVLEVPVLALKLVELLLQLCSEPGHNPYDALQTRYNTPQRSTCVFSFTTCSRWFL